MLWRGWTLQELIAPSKALFYNKLWRYCGSNNGYDFRDGYSWDTDLNHRIGKLTAIDRELLGKADSVQKTQYLSSIPACQKMYWASKRGTTKDKNMAYCLIGIFESNISP